MKAYNKLLIFLVMKRYIPYLAIASFFIIFQSCSTASAYDPAYYDSREELKTDKMLFPEYKVSNSDEKGYDNSESNASEEFVDDNGGNTYINNYYEDDGYSSYESRIRRFGHSSYCDSYYDPYYSCSFTVGLGYGYPYYTYPYYAYPYYGYRYYDPFYYDYWSYRPYYYGGYWGSYSHGYYNGYS